MISSQNIVSLALIVLMALSSAVCISPAASAEGSVSSQHSNHELPQKNQQKHVHGLAVLDHQEATDNNSDPLDCEHCPHYDCADNCAQMESSLTNLDLIGSKYNDHQLDNLFALAYFVILFPESTPSAVPPSPRPVALLQPFESPVKLFDRLLLDYS